MRRSLPISALSGTHGGGPINNSKDISEKKGAVITERNGINRSVIDFLKKGMYIICFQLEDKVVSSKFIKE